jgi:CheY-like chemotaxis protein
MAGPFVLLCVDDEQDALNLRVTILKRAGYDVLSTTVPEHALYLLASNDVDLVLMDHLLPGMPGTDLARQMKTLRPHLPIILLSGMIEEPQGMANVDQFISKAEPTETMLARIAVLLASEKRPRGIGSE